ncbi:MAG: sn-glycerol-3-phosphate transporter ATP-binding protein UgpC [Pseudomonadota bacterium]|jgi:multiple sugar transport system ATP-binding protein
MARIECRQMVKRYGRVTAVHALDLVIEDNEFVVLLGPSGCGKTTTLNVIAGLEDLSAGDLLFDDEVVNFVSPDKRNIAMVFQSYALYPQKTVFENIAFGLRLRGVDRAEISRRVLEVAEQLEISQLLERRPAELSGGQRQRVALGRAIVRQPSVFLMDEPLSNLDAALRVSMRALIKKLHLMMRTTFVYVTHDQAEAMTLADRIVVMDQGRVQQTGTPDEIYNRPQNLFVASFLGSPQMNLVAGHVVREAGELRFAQGDFRLPLGSVPAAEGQHITLGVRPEDCLVDAAGLQAIVSLVSPLGSETHATVSVSGVELVTRLAKDVVVHPGSTLGLKLDSARLHWFDTQSGRALQRAA